MRWWLEFASHHSSQSAALVPKSWRAITPKAQCADRTMSGEPSSSRRTKARGRAQHWPAVGSLGQVVPAAASELRGDRPWEDAHQLSDRRIPDLHQLVACTRVALHEPLDELFAVVGEIDDHAR